jgi:hypothetical protein
VLIVVDGERHLQQINEIAGEQEGLFKLLRQYTTETEAFVFTQGYRLNQRGLYANVMRGPQRQKINEGTLVEGESEKVCRCASISEIEKADQSTENFRDFGSSVQAAL